MYAGLSGLELLGDHFEIGRGLTIRRTFAHLMLPTLMAFAPAEPERAHPGPWKSVKGSSGFDILAELNVPASIGTHEEQWDTARAVLFLLRLGVQPATSIAAVADQSFSTMANAADDEVKMTAWETRPRTFQLHSTDGGRLDNVGATWVAERWEKTKALRKKSAEFDLAVYAMDSGQFQRGTAMTLVSLWGALEALFGGDRNELRFRISSYIASYLVPYGQERDTKQKAIAKLYDKRSAAVHGIPSHNNDDVLAAFILMREVLMKIVDEGEVPTRAKLDKALFG